jgi:hypothetical protein
LVETQCEDSLQYDDPPHQSARQHAAGVLLYGHDNVDYLGGDGKIRAFRALSDYDDDLHRDDGDLTKSNV